MRLSTVAALVVLVLSGCGSSQYQAPDPFAAWGHRRVPPPATGTIVNPGTASPYYQSSPATPGLPPGTGTQFTPARPGAVITPSSYVPAAHGVPFVPTNWKSAEAEPASAPTQFGAQKATLATEPQQTAVPAAMGGLVGSGLAATQQPQLPGQTQIEHPRYQPLPNPSLSNAAVGVGVSHQAPTAPSTLNPMTPNTTVPMAPPRLFSPPTNAMDITQLPRVPSATGANGAAGAIPPGASHPVSIRDSSLAMTGWNSQTPPAGAAPSQAAPSQAGSAPVGTPIIVQTGGYGYQPDYSWLKGKLDYSITSRRWKLRYIPRDASENRIDEFGGSVILVDSGQLAGFSSGEFVRVEGRLAGHAAGVRGFAPTYQVARVQRQTN